jgi:hypothetical protein
MKEKNKVEIMKRIIKTWKKKWKKYLKQKHKK